jgi:ArsR family transcriptional regulator
MTKQKLNLTERLLAALAEHNRLRILMMLKTKDLAVCEIREILGLSFSTVSRHLFLLREAGLVNSVKDGKRVNYSLNSELPEATKGWLDLLLEQLSSDPVIQQDKKTVAKLNKHKTGQKIRKPEIKIRYWLA